MTKQQDVARGAVSTRLIFLRSWLRTHRKPETEPDAGRHDPDRSDVRTWTAGGIALVLLVIACAVEAYVH